MNRVIQLGNFVRDPDFTVSGSGTEICRFSIAVNQRVGEQEKVNYFDWKAFGSYAKLIRDHFHQGKAILVDGRANQQRWEEKETGNKRSRVEFVLERFDFVGSKREAEGQRAEAKEPEKDPLNEPLDEDEEIPF